MLLLKITIEIHRKLLAPVTDVLARKKILQEKSKCHNCVKTEHSVKNCTSHHCCFACKAKHHISICGSKINSVKKYNVSENQAK